jgi:two-component system sensor histidine kinase HydH
MLYKNSGQSGQAPGGLHGSDALSDYLGCGLILIHGLEQNLTFAGAAERILGLSASVTQRTIADLPGALRKLAQEGMASGKEIKDRQIDVSAPGRGLISLHVSAVPTQPGANGPGMALIIEDLTSIKRLEQDIRRLDRLANLGTLSASMAHEIKNALVAGKTFIDLLIEKAPQTEMAGVVQREIGRIDTIVSQMLRFSGLAKPAFTAVHLHEVLEHSLRLVGPQLKAKSIGLSQNFDASSDLVRGDDHQLEQAFVNLLLNSLEAMGQHGKLIVGTELLALEGSTGDSQNGAPMRQLHVTITDNGAGIPRENMARLFEPFFTTKASGTGLGLAITKRIIQEHQGLISIESEPNKGARFLIAFPAADDQRVYPEDEAPME